MGRSAIINICFAALLLIKTAGAAVEAAPPAGSNIGRIDTAAAHIDQQLTALFAKDVSTLSMNERDGAAEGLYLLYASDMNNENLTRMRAGLSHLLDIDLKSEQHAERMMVLSTQFLQAVKVPQDMTTRNSLFSFAKAKQQVDSGNIRSAREELLKIDSGSTFSLTELKGLRGLVEILVKQGDSRDEAAAKVWATYEHAQDTSLVFVGQLLFAARQTYEFAAIDQTQTAKLAGARMSVVESLLKSRDLLAEADIGLACFGLLKEEQARLNPRLTPSDMEQVSERFKQDESTLNDVKNANIAWAKETDRLTSILPNIYRLGQIKAMTEGK